MRRQDWAFPEMSPFSITSERVLARPSWQPLGVGCGGGVNTGAALVLLYRLGIRPDIIWFADTGARSEKDANGYPTEGEHPDTYEWMDRHLDPWLARIGFPARTIVTNLSPEAGHKSLYSECIANGVLPGRAYGKAGCTVKWKIRAQEDWIKREAWAAECYRKSELPIKILGYDAGAREVLRAERQGNHDRAHDKCIFGRQCGHVQFWYPLVEKDIDRPGCEDLIRSEGLPLPPGSSCWYCPNMTPDEVLSLKDTRPAYFWKGVAMEENSRARGGLYGSVKGLGMDWSWGSLVDMKPEERACLPTARGSCMTCAVDSQLGLDL